MKHQTYNKELALACARMRMQMPNKHNLVLYVDRELVENTRNLGLNLSKTFENHLKQLLTQLSCVNSLNNIKNNENNDEEWAGPDSNRRPSARQAPALPSDELLTRFREYLKVDLRRSDKTAYEHTYYVKKFLNALPKSIENVNVDDVRAYLKSLSIASSAKYKNVLMALKLFFRDYLKMPEIISSFKFPHQAFKPKQIVSREQLKQFYNCIDTAKEKALFLLYASSGLRRDEILSLQSENIDFDKRMITPNNHQGDTKKSWISFFNAEAEQALKEYFATRKPTRSKRLFPMQRREVVELWKTAREKTGIDITPQKLRQWFCSEMIRLGVSDTYIDAFCGRTPKSVLARHHTDYSPEKLRGIYEKAAIEILN